MAVFRFIRRLRNNIAVSRSVVYKQFFQITEGIYFGYLVVSEKIYD